MGHQPPPEASIESLLWIEGYPAPRKLEKIGSCMSGVWVDTTYMYFVVLQLQI